MGVGLWAVLDVCAIGIFVKIKCPQFLRGKSTGRMQRYEQAALPLEKGNISDHGGKVVHSKLLKTKLYKIKTKTNEYCINLFYYNKKSYIFKECCKDENKIL